MDTYPTDWPLENWFDEAEPRVPDPDDETDSDYAWAGLPTVKALRVNARFRRQVKARVNWSDLMDKLGIRTSALHGVGDARYITLCPYHDERSPSFFLYAHGRAYCHGCAQNVDMVDVVLDLVRPQHARELRSFFEDPRFPLMARPSSQLAREHDMAYARSIRLRRSINRR